MLNEPIIDCIWQPVEYLQDRADVVRRALSRHRSRRAQEDVSDETTSLQRAGVGLFQLVPPRLRTFIMLGPADRSQ